MIEQIVQITTSSIGFAISIWIAFIVKKSGERIARAQYTGNMHETWNKFNELALADERNLEIARWMFTMDRDPTGLDPARVQYMGFIAFNAIHAPFLGGEFGVMEKGYTDTMFDQLMTPLVLKDDLYTLTQSRGYHPKFSQACADLRTRLKEASYKGSLHETDFKAR